MKYIECVSDIPIFIGVNPDYARRRDVEIQTRFARPEVRVVYSLQDLVNQVKIWAQHKLPATSLSSYPPTTYTYTDNELPQPHH